MYTTNNKNNNNNTIQLTNYNQDTKREREDMKQEDGHETLK